MRHGHSGERDFVAHDWHETLGGQGLLRTGGGVDFDALWQLDAQQVDAPNAHRGGWSTVARRELVLAQGGTRGVYIKRQENFSTRSWRHPLAGNPTTLRELRQLLLLRGRGVPCVEPVCFALRREGRDHRAVLLTAALDGFLDLDALAARWRDEPAPWVVRRRVVDAVAGSIRALHACRIRHGCLYPKHVFVRIATGDEAVEARLIDLEKAGWRPLRALVVVHDLTSFCAYLLQGCSRSERLRFLCTYLGEERVTPEAKRLWRRIDARLQRRWQKMARRKSLAASTGRLPQ